MNNDDLFYKLLILRTPRIGPARYNELISTFGGVAAAAAAIPATPAHIDNVRREMDAAAKIGAQYISDDDPRYPAALKDVKNHPPVICVRGNADVLLKPMVAMVGTRHATATGMEFMARMADGFASRGWAVVSGMAIGCDTAAHRGALRCGATVAVLAGGVDYIWPTENESLYWDIVSRGAIISEMPVGFVPNGPNFIQRNRIIAGISQKLILGEADANSGSMATARFAIDYGRPVFAVPSHPADSRGAGPNSLIKSGAARLCDSINDFFDSNIVATHKNNAPASDSKNDILDCLGTVPVSESVLTQIVKKTISEIKAELVVLELQGLVRKTDAGYVRM